MNLYDTQCENALPFYHQFQEVNIDVHIHVPQMSVQIFADEMCMQRIFANMFSIVVKHAKQYVHIELERENKQICIRFRNDIQKDFDVNTLFERFYTADHARSLANTGLGLAIVKELVERLHGNVKGELTGQCLCIPLSFPIYNAKK